MARSLWTPEQLDALRRLYPDYPCNVVAKVLKRPIGSVYQKAAALGIEKSEAFKASDLSGRIQRGKQDPAMIESRFKPGSTPWNKGTHFTAGGRSAETRFKRGELMGAARHNYVPVGSLRVNADGYLERKLTDDLLLYPARRWVAVHRIVWEAANGPVPAGHIVVFKRGMKTFVLEEVTLNRLDCITRAENLRRNSWRSRYPELAGVVQLKGAITRQANRIKRMAAEAEKANDE